MKDSGEIALIDILLARNGNDIEINVYRKPKHNNMYLHLD